MRNLSTIDDLLVNSDSMEHMDRVSWEMDEPTYSLCNSDKRERMFLNYFRSNALPSIYSNMNHPTCVELNNEKAISSDWYVSSSDLLDAIVKVIDDQPKSFRNDFYKSVARKILNERKQRNSKFIK